MCFLFLYCAFTMMELNAKDIDFPEGLSQLWFLDFKQSQILPWLRLLSEFIHLRIG